MKKLKVVTSFTTLPVVDKASFCRNVLVKMANNALFNAPDVSFADATAGILHSGLKVVDTFDVNKKLTTSYRSH